MVVLRVLLSASLLWLVTCVAGCSGSNNGADEAAEVKEIAPGELTDDAAPSETGALSVLPSPSADAALPEGATSSPLATPSGDATGGSASPPKPVDPRTSLEGRWDVALHGIGGTMVGLLIDIVPTDNGYEVKSVGESPIGWILGNTQVSGNDVHLEITDPAQQKIDFRGAFVDGVVRGSIDSGGVRLDLASLRPSSREALSADDFQEVTGDLEKINALKPDENLLRDLLRLAQDSAATPLGYQLYNRVLSGVQMYPTQQVDLPGLLEGLFSAAAPWGKRVVTFAHMDVAFTLALRGNAPEDALRHLDLAEQGLDEDASPAQQERLGLTRGLILVSSEETRDQGLELLVRVRENNPYNLLATSKLAEVYEQTGSLEDALAMHVEILALPSIPGDRGKVVDLWEQLGRDPEKFDAFLDEIYEKVVYRFCEQDERGEPAIEGQQVLLGELFTGATCPPCVAADVATGALERIHPRSRFVLIRYHQHIPGPDPMTISDGELRRDFYEIRGTPTLFLNGRSFQGIGGGFMNAPGVYASLRNLIAPMLEQTTTLSIELAADVDSSGESIHLRAAVVGADEYPENWRLRLCLAEDKIHYPAPNGIRIHEMVVRSMPGGANGVLAEQGTLSFEEDIPISEILSGIEEGIGAANARSGGTLPEMQARLSSLQLVAFVQDDDTFEVLQTAIVPVTGLAETPADSADSGTDNP